MRNHTQLKIFFAAGLIALTTVATPAQVPEAQSLGWADHASEPRAVLVDSQRPVPLINLPLVPDATAPGGATFTLSVNGTGFVSGSVVNWNGNPRATTFVSTSQLRAQISAADIAKAGTASVTVVNPPPGGGMSNTALLGIANNTGNSVAFTPSPSLKCWH